MVEEGGAAPLQLGARQRGKAFGWPQVIGLLVGDDQDNVVRSVERAVAAARVALGELVCTLAVVMSRMPVRPSSVACEQHLEGRVVKKFFYKPGKIISIASAPG